MDRQTDRQTETGRERQTETERRLERKRERERYRERERKMEKEREKERDHSINGGRSEENHQMTWYPVNRAPDQTLQVDGWSHLLSGSDAI